jgi:hypothetical protein
MMRAHLKQFWRAILLGLGVSLLVAAPTKFASARTGLVLIDMQDLFVMSADPAALKELVANQVQMLRWAYFNQVPVMVFEYNHSGPTISPLREAAQANPEVRFIEKYSDNGFIDERKLADRPETILKDWGVDRIIFMGVNARACVLKTIRGALKCTDAKIETSLDLVRNTFTREESLKPPGSFGLSAEPRFREVENYRELMSCDVLFSQGK